jgi:hypothetical protein
MKQGDEGASAQIFGSDVQKLQIWYFNILPKKC